MDPDNPLFAQESVLERKPFDDTKPASDMHRRHFLAISAAGIGGVLFCAADKCMARVPNADKALQIPLHFFDSRQALLIAAAVSRIFPSDELGPGAKEAGVVIYIDRHLAGPYGSDRGRYTKPPFEAGIPELGYQGKSTPAEIYKEGLRTLAGFTDLTTDQQDKRLQEIESSLFFSLLRQHTIEGMFCDPIHGGNVDMLGWQLVGFPGPRMSNYEDVDKHFGEAFRPPPVSLSEGKVNEKEG
jgi:gluconate 2-dehydrogenase gamma chain